METLHCTMYTVLTSTSETHCTVHTPTVNIVRNSGRHALGLFFYETGALHKGIRRNKEDYLRIRKDNIEASFGKYWKHLGTKWPQWDG